MTAASDDEDPVRRAREAELYAQALRLLDRALAVMDDLGDPLVAAQIALPIETIARRCRPDGDERSST